MVQSIYSVLIIKKFLKLSAIKKQTYHARNIPVNLLPCVDILCLLLLLAYDVNIYYNIFYNIYCNIYLITLLKNKKLNKKRLNH